MTARQPEPEPRSVFDIPLDEGEEASLDALAEAEIDAGQHVDNDRVIAWLESWGTSNPLPRPRPIPENE